MKRLAVSGAFHSKLMEPAVKPFIAALSKVEISDPVVTVYSNVNGRKYKDAEQIKRQLPQQVGFL